MAGWQVGCQHILMSHGTARPFSWRLLGVGFALTLLILAVGFGICEALGWPFLAGPMQRWLGTTLERRVSLSADSAAKPEVVIHLLGGIKLKAGYIEIGAPAWSSAPYMLLARDAHLILGYADLWRAHRGEPLRIRELRAGQLDGQFERLADGRASWQFGKKTDVPDTAEQPPRMPVFGRLQVDSGTIVYRDALMAVDLDGRFSLVDGSKLSAAGVPPASGPAKESVVPSTGPSSGPAPGTATITAGPVAGLQFKAKGSYRKLPLSIDVQTSGVLPLIADDAAVTALPVTIDAHIGRATAVFRGTATDAVHLTALQGRFVVQGPSLAAVGDPVGITLPTTGAFHTEGQLVKQGVVWNVVLDHMSIGTSRLAGAFTYDPRPRLPLLSGRLTGTRLALADLAPAVGGAVKKVPAMVVEKKPNPAMDKRPTTVVDKRPAPMVEKGLTQVGKGLTQVDKGLTQVGKGSTLVAEPAAPQRVNATPGRMLPDHEFDLPSLRAMNANVLIAIDTVDLGSGLLEPLKPLHTHLVLTDGVLTLHDIDARTGQGHLSGTVEFDGRDAQALWTANVRWDGVRLERWIHQERANNAPPWASGSLSGQARVAGQGKSTAAILGNLRGGVRMNLVNGTISHLAVEAAGLDVAESLGMLIKGDDSLRIQCSVADLVAEKGVLRPRALVLDTTDSTLWVEGSLSLASEAIDLRVSSAPKDFSPLTLRAPIQLRGSFANPSVSVEKGKLGMRLGASALLAFINPLAALIPLIDTGDSAEAKRGADDCRALSRRIAATPSLPPAKPAMRGRMAVKAAG